MAANLRRGLEFGSVVAVVLVLVAIAIVGNRPRHDTVQAPPAPVCPRLPQPAADLDGDGCEEPVRWVDGVLQVGMVRFALGGPGDAWAVGDWDCDGRRTPALLHQGSLAVFDAWPGPGAELQGRQVATVPEATELGVRAGPDGCDQPSLRRPGAGDLIVDARRSP